jgi:hypothetical protein
MEHRRGVSASDSLVAAGVEERIVHFTTLGEFEELPSKSAKLQSPNRLRLKRDERELLLVRIFRFNLSAVA